MWLVVSLTLAGATFQLKLVLVSRLHSWVRARLLGSLGPEHQLTDPHSVKHHEPGLPPPIAQQQCQVASSWPSPPPDGRSGAKKIVTKIFGTAMGERALVTALALPRVTIQ